MFNAFAAPVRWSAIRASLVHTRALHSTPVAGTVTERVSEVADKVNKGVGRKLADAIETGEKVTEATKETVGSAAEKTRETVGASPNAAKKNNPGGSAQEGRDKAEKGDRK
ncbi:hypothetical protein LshimejAT787_0308070 [Lyophyllum shimeji]|uniref:Uncharacterized protein n=1 Tax=Lyophyllum shimeji TaxID=47721 RepID=A0A9P3UJ49_LYOSH|nr:hypothetical protein LshimejAT787_0308070 [Lyophyllum shimeji]